MFASDYYLWNAGIFLFRAKDMIEAFSEYAPESLRLVSQAINEASIDLGFLRLAADPWTKLEDISIDYAIMEKTKNLVAIPLKCKWSDLGDWNAVAGQLPHDDKGNFVNGTASQIDCENTTLWSVADGTQLVGLGLKNIVTVVMDDAVLVADAKRMQDVRHVVDQLEAADIMQAHQHAKDYRPWGWFESLVNTPGYQVKRLHVYPKAALSLQSHQHRSEHWVVVSGTAKVVRGSDEFLLKENQSAYISLGEVHSLENVGDDDLELIEVQSGNYLGEDDIVRLEDSYGRES